MLTFWVVTVDLKAHTNGITTEKINTDCSSTFPLPEGDCTNTFTHLKMTVFWVVAPCSLLEDY
jgi:hypothetical protein